MADVAIQKTSQATLKEWLHAVAERQDKRAFKCLFDHYVPLLRAYSLSREQGAFLLADELAQDVMIKVWNKASSYNPQLANTNTWIFTLARNTRIDHLRRNGRYSTNIESSDIFDSIEDQAPGPFQQVQQRTVERTIQQGLSTLPKEQAEVLSTVYLQGCSHQEASNKLKLPLGTVKSRTRLALKKMQLLMGGQ